MKRKGIFEQRVAQTIDQHQLLLYGKRYLVGLSGGADSIALVCCLKALGYQLEAVHCNFELRGTESDRDEIFVRDFCKKQNILLHVRHFQTRTYASNHHVSIEMAARDLRYQWFRALLTERNASAIVVAHHRDDNAETVLLNLIRGTGIRGLCGMRYKNDDVVRPLLDLSRGEIESYLAELGQGYVTDSTNWERDATRNKIRLDVLPLLQQINPVVKQTLHELAQRMSDTEVLYRRAVEEAVARVFHGDKLSLRALREESGAETILYEILAPKGFNAAQVRSVYELDPDATGKMFESQEWVLLYDRDYLIFRQKNQILTPISVEELPVKPGLVTITDDLVLQIGLFRADSYVIQKDKSYLCLDADKIKEPLRVRRCEQGDRFCPYGMKGSKLVSDFLTDCKKNRFQKENQFVLTCGDSIVWVIGERSDRRFAIDNQTQRVVEIKIVGF